MKLTTEQQEAVDHFNTTDDVKVIAFAGAGKTSTLVAMASSDEASGGLYLAFNKRIADEANGKFPFNVRCSTAHSLAFRSVVKTYDKDKMTKPMKIWEAGLDSVSFVNDLRKSNGLVRQAVNKFMQSSDHELTLDHVIGEQELKARGYEIDGVKITYGQARQEVFSRAKRLWGRMTDRADPLSLTHDGYLKVWAMSKPVIPTDVLFVDEAQDLNPVLVEVVRRQCCQVVSVGDSHQQIYEWRGAVDALQILDGHRSYLTQSFRFGLSIAEHSMRLLDTMGEAKQLRGFEMVDDSVTHYENGALKYDDTDAVICRTNAGVFDNLIANVDGSRPLYVPGGVMDMRDWLLDAQLLQAGRPARPGDLEGFKSWKEVVDFAKTDEGYDLEQMVRLVEKHGVERLLKLLERIKTEPEGDCLTITTTHKAKGLEWSRVIVGSDFCIPMAKYSEDIYLPVSRVRLLYVAMTRAKLSLSIPEGILSAYEEAIIVPDKDWKGYFG